jgi:rod shape-determining protein MreC
VVLQIVALSLLFRYNKFHEAAFMRVANEVTGRISYRYDNVEYYFRLKKANEQLVQENEELRNKLATNYSPSDTSSKTIKDSIPYDTIGTMRTYVWRNAKVVNNTVMLQNNFITIHRGEKQGVKKGMGVISPTGVAGTIINTSENFAVAMSVLNRESKVQAKIKKTGETGSVFWDGQDPHFITMSNVPKSVPIAVGDSIVTNQYSTIYPQGILVGTVAEIINDKASNFYTLKLKTSTNFYTLEHVMVVENLQREEQKKLEEATGKNQ